jgi:hypothetical protein
MFMKCVEVFKQEGEEMLEGATPYLIGFVAGFAVCYAIGILRFDGTLFAGHQKKTFTSQQDDCISNEQIQQRLEHFRSRVQSGQVSEDIH